MKNMHKRTTTLVLHNSDNCLNFLPKMMRRNVFFLSFLLLTMTNGMKRNEKYSLQISRFSTNQLNKN